MIILISAYDENRVIGNNDKLPWNLPEETNYFKQVINNKVVIVGYKTYSYIKDIVKFDSGYVLSRKQHEWNTANLEITDDVNSLILKYKGNENKDIYVLGGQETYETFIDYADELIISHIKGEHKGDKYFPIWDSYLFKNQKTIIDNNNFTTIMYSK